MDTDTKEKPAAGTIVVETGPYSKREDGMSPATPPSTLMQALAVAAADPRMDVAKVERLWVMHKEMMDREREALFNEAMARAQANIQPIVKDRENSHTRSWYATLAAIVDEVTPVVTAEGLSVSFDTFDPARDKELPVLEKGWVRVIALVSHKAGHSRKHHADGPLDDAGKDGTKNKTGIQAMGSTVSYLRRYLVCMIFNVATADDNDGNKTGGNGGSKLPEKARLDHLAAIESAENEQALIRVFGPAWNAAQDAKDKEAQQAFIAARDAQRKTFKARRP